MNDMLAVDEHFTLKSEVLNLEFDLKTYKNKSFRPALIVRMGEEVLVRLLLTGPEYTKLKAAFQKKEDATWNFFNHILHTVEEATEKL